jgi:hypothetical protein
VFATFEYPGGITGTFSSVESNAFDERYEAFFGTKGTLIMRNENEAMLFDEGAARATGIDVAPKGAGAALQASETKSRQAGGHSTTTTRTPARAQAVSPSTYEINGWASALRTGSALRVTPQVASHSASWTIAANEAMKTGQIVDIP